MGGDTTMADFELNHKNAQRLLAWLRGHKDSELDELKCTEVVGLFDEMAERGFYDVSFFQQGEQLATALFKAYANGGSVLDIGSGIGHFIRHTDIGSRYKGEEISHDEAELSRLLISKAGRDNAEIEEVDALLNFGGERYDQVFCNMPFIGRIDKRYHQTLAQLTDYHIETRSLPDWLFAIRVVESLTEEGVGIAIMRLSSLSSIKDRPIRKQLIEKGLIRAVIELPDQLTKWSTAEMALVVFDKRYDGDVVLIDARKMGSQLSHYRERQLADQDIKRIVKAVSEDDTLAIRRSAETIRQMDYTLRATVQQQEGTELSEVATLFRGGDMTKQELEKDEEKMKSGYLLNLSELQNSYIEMPKQRLSQDILNSRSKLVLQTGDIVLTARGSSLKVAMVTERISTLNVIPSSNIMVCRCHAIDPYYVFAYLNSTVGRKRLRQLQTGSSLFVLSLKNMQQLTLPAVDQTVANDMKDTLLHYQKLMQQVESYKEKLPRIYQE